VREHKRKGPTDQQQPGGKLPLHLVPRGKKARQKKNTMKCGDRWYRNKEQSSANTTREVDKPDKKRRKSLDQGRWKVTTNNQPHTGQGPKKVKSPGTYLPMGTSGETWEGGKRRGGSGCQLNLKRNGGKLETKWPGNRSPLWATRQGTKTRRKRRPEDRTSVKGIHHQ